MGQKPAKPRNRFFRTNLTAMDDKYRSYPAKRFTRLHTCVITRAMKDGFLKPELIQAKVRLEPAHSRVRPAVFSKDQGSSSVPTLVIENRYVDGKAVKTILLDSVPSMANRMEALLAAKREEIGFDDIAVKVEMDSFSGEPQEELISQWLLPHRVYDAILRDSLIALNGEKVPFFSTEIGRKLARGEPASLFRYAPNVYLFGAWNSHIQAGVGARVAPRIERAVVAEVYGLDPQLLSHPGSRRDPLGIPGNLPLTKTSQEYQDWIKQQGKTGSNMSDLGYGNLPPKLETLEVSVSEVRLDFLVTPVPWQQRGLPGEVREVLFLLALLALSLLLEDGHLHLRSGTTLQLAEQVVLRGREGSFPLPSPEELIEQVKKAASRLPDEYRWKGERLILEPMEAIKKILREQEGLRLEVKQSR